MRLLELIEEDNGKLSFSRVLSTVIVTVVLGLVVFSTLKNGNIPDLNGATLFLTGGIASLYGTNKIANAIENK